MATPVSLSDSSVRTAGIGSASSRGRRERTDGVIDSGQYYFVFRPNAFCLREEQCMKVSDSAKINLKGLFISLLLDFLASV